ncbi:MAG: Uma2 family endonuclease [Saprospiraceae bacterium]|nr:Uma2 family endonuclease [Saprospiraceae bacterium]
MLKEEVLESLTQFMTEEEFFRFCRENDQLRIERDKNGNILLMPPSGFETGRRNSKLTAELVFWNEKTNPGGEVGDSSTGYTLPNGAVRSPDASWISHKRLTVAPPESRERFIHAVPEFIAEIRSKSDRPKTLREKMQEYIECGVLLGWYIDVPGQLVEIYRANGEAETKEGFDQVLSGETVLPGFVFDLKWMK